MADLNLNTHPSERKSNSNDQAPQREQNAQTGFSGSSRPARKHESAAQADLSVDHVAILGYD